MNNQSKLKSPIPLCLLGPIPPLALALYSELHGDGMVFSTLALVAVITVFGWGSAAYLYFWSKKIVRERVYLELRPNVIQTANGEVFRGDFSSDDRLVAYPEKLNDCVVAVVTRKSHSGQRFMFSRESACVRIFPDGRGISSLEVEAIHDIFESEFVAPVIQVVDSMGLQAGADIGIKA